MSAPVSPFLPGSVFGELEVVRQLPSEGGQRRYELRCACGRLQLRSARSLLAARRAGHVSCCPSCAGEVRRGATEVRRAERQGLYRVMWDLWGTLYSPRFDERELAALREETGIGEPDEPLDMSDLSIASAARSIGGGQRGAYLHAIDAGDGRCWRCPICRAWFQAGLGCLQCRGIVCAACFVAERHTCRDGRPTYEEAMERKDEILCAIVAAHPSLERITDRRHLPRRAA